jgi:WD repeat-containing protein 68
MIALAARPESGNGTYPGTATITITTTTMTTNNEHETNYCDNLAIEFDKPDRSLLQLGDIVSTLDHSTKSVDNDDQTDAPPITRRAQSVVDRKKEVYKFETNWLISNVSWSKDGTYKLAVTSYLEQYKNFVQIVNLDNDEPGQEIESVCTFEHPYPATKVLWSPQTSIGSSPMLATTADYLRLWRFDKDELASSGGVPTEFSQNTGDKRVKLECLLDANRAPLTSFDWSDDAALIVTSSLDTSCTVWDITVGKAISSFDSESIVQNMSSKVSTLNDHHVYDIAWSHRATGREEIVLCRDDSIRLVDLRGPNDPVVLYELENRLKSSGDGTSLVRVSCSKQDSNLVATFANDSGRLLVIDLRKTGQTLCTLDHSDSVNAISWSPRSSKGICSGGDDNQALIWRIPEHADQFNEPLLAYRASGKINAIDWSPSNIFISIGYQNTLELLRV